LAAAAILNGCWYEDMSLRRLRFGDPDLDKAFVSLSAEAQANLQEKPDKMRQFHMDRLKKQGLSNVGVDPPKLVSL
jgi:hypothetical protein